MSFAEFFGAVFPAEDNTETGERYGPIDTLLAGAPGELNGNLTQPLGSDVRDGVQYGANGTEFTGSIVISGAITVLPENVREGVATGDPASPGVGTIQLPDEDEVLLGVGYGDSGTERVGTLSFVGVGGGTFQTNVDSLGDIRGPLVIGRDYLNQYGMGFVWRIPLPFDPSASGTARFVGRKKACPGDTNCPTTYDWDVEDLSIASVDVGGVTHYDFTFELQDTHSDALVPGEYDWWIIWNEVQIQLGTVTWVCG